jgi:SH3-like domain-containing protein
MGGWRKLKVDGREGWADSENLWGADDCRGLEK